MGKDGYIAKIKSLHKRSKFLFKDYVLAKLFTLIPHFAFLFVAVIFLLFFFPCLGGKVDEKCLLSSLPGLLGLIFFYIIMLILFSPFSFSPVYVAFMNSNFKKSVDFVVKNYLRAFLYVILWFLISLAFGIFSSLLGVLYIIPIIGFVISIVIYLLYSVFDAYVSIGLVKAVMKKGSFLSHLEAIKENKEPFIISFLLMFFGSVVVLALIFVGFLAASIFAVLGATVSFVGLLLALLVGVVLVLLIIAVSWYVELLVYRAFVVFGKV